MGPDLAYHLSRLLEPGRPESPAPGKGHERPAERKVRREGAAGCACARRRQWAQPLSPRVEGYGAGTPLNHWSLKAKNLILEKKWGD